ncbi:MAG: AsnC family transcriptional regulator [Chloroflexi bacterium]|nr:AsnC family transcriptional regulator [Chloroflexota bacterium]MCL5075364.1 AsnC family transcriptional regulator [Chloroflexota bacterium]
MVEAKIRDLDLTDKRLLNVLQSEFPLCERPFKAIAERLHLSEAEVLERVRRLKESGLIRQISAIFDSRQLGYRSALVAMQVPEERLAEVAALISAHPGVSHNYRREHAYNLWFTLTVPPESNPQQVASGLAQQVGVERMMYLPATKAFKIGVNFDLGGS